MLVSIASNNMLTKTCTQNIFPIIYYENSQAPVNVEKFTAKTHASKTWIALVTCPWFVPQLSLSPFFYPVISPFNFLMHFEMRGRHSYTSTHSLSRNLRSVFTYGSYRRYF
jgi:hypothetical protein